MSDMPDKMYAMADREERFFFTTFDQDGVHGWTEYTRTALVDELPKFPTAIRKMWSGQEVQNWIDENIIAKIKESES